MFKSFKHKNHLLCNLSFVLFLSCWSIFSPCSMERTLSNIYLMPVSMQGWNIRCMQNASMHTRHNHHTYLPISIHTYCIYKGLSYFVLQFSHHLGSSPPECVIITLVNTKSNVEKCDVWESISLLPQPS